MTVRRQAGPSLAPRQGPGYDDHLPHDAVHLLVENEAGLTGGVFGRVAAGRSNIFWPADPKLQRRQARREAKRRRPRPSGPTWPVPSCSPRSARRCGSYVPAGAATCRHGFRRSSPLSWTLRWWSASSNAWTTSQCAGTHSPSAAASRSRGYHATPTGPARSRTTPLAGQFRRSCARRPHRHGLRRGLLRQGLHLGQARATVVPNNTFSTKASTARETS